MMMATEYAYTPQLGNGQAFAFRPLANLDGERRALLELYGASTTPEPVRLRALRRLLRLNAERRDRAGGAA